MFAQDDEIIFVFWLITSFVGVIFFYFIFFMIKKQKELTKLQKMITFSQKKAISKERKEIATVLHNDIAPMLAGLKMRMGQLETPNTEELDVCKGALEESVQKLRKISKVIAPLSMLNISYKHAISQHIDMVSQGNELKIHYTDSNQEEFEEELNNDIYRILQEIIHNAIRHANAKYLHIEISLNDGQLLIRTKDDGIGYNFNALLLEKKLGMGLLNMRARIESHGGTISSPNPTQGGTRYNICIPIKQ